MIKRKGKGKYLRYCKRRIDKIERNHKKKKNRFNGVTGKRKDPNQEVSDKKKFVISKHELDLVRRKIDEFWNKPITFEITRHKSFLIPKAFSFFDNPNIVINIMRQIYYAGVDRSIDTIQISHKDCESLGLDASVFMDIIVLAVIRYRKKINSQFEILGDFVENGETKDVLLASGLPMHLGLKLNIDYDKTKVEKFDIISGVNNPDDKKSDLISTRVTEYFDRCLKTQKFKLNDDGKLLLSNILGEVINNSIIHGGESSTWYTLGHYQIINNNEYGEMQLVFLNIGDTIFEGLSKESSDETIQLLHRIDKKHRKLYSDTWTREMLYTVFSLQEGISRLKDRNKTGYGSRGTGTVNLMEMFYNIGETDSGLHPKMTLTSGHTHIIFNQKYKLSNVKFDNDDIFDNRPKKIIAFNATNDIYSRPDSNNVIRLQEYFPGTIISLRFYLDSRFIQRTKKGENGNV